MWVLAQNRGIQMLLSYGVGVWGPGTAAGDRGALLDVGLGVVGDGAQVPEAPLNRGELISLQLAEQWTRQTLSTLGPGAQGGSHNGPGLVPAREPRLPRGAHCPSTAALQEPSGVPLGGPGEARCQRSPTRGLGRQERGQRDGGCSGETRDPGGCESLLREKQQS